MNLVPPGDPAALAQAILETLAHPYDSLAAQERAQYFSSETAINAYLTLFEDLLEGNQTHLCPLQPQQPPQGPATS